MNTKMTNRFAVLLLALSMMLTMGTAAFAAVPSAADTATVTVTDAETGATVNLYKIAEPTYDTYGFTGYKTVTGYTIADLENPTEAELATILQAIVTGNKAADYTMDESTTTAGTYTKEVKAGMYLALVEKTNSVRLYNPMVLSAGYNDANEVSTTDPKNPEGGSVSAGTTSKYFDTGYAKSTKPEVDKKIVDSNKNNSGDTAGLGSSIKFQIGTTIPSYSKAYTAPAFKISDNLSTGLELDTSSVIVTVGTQKYAKTADTANNIKALSEIAGTVTIETGELVLDFKSDFIKDNGLATVTVDYTATVTKDAPSNFNPSTNIATIDYSNDPKDATKKGTKEDKTYTYTFGLDSNLGGKDPDGKPNEDTKDLQKKGEVKSSTPGTTPATQPLGGAKFTLFKDSACTTPQPINEDPTGGTVTTLDTGYFSMTGLPEGTFYLKETKAPKGYTLDPTVHTVKITAELNSDGTLKSYSVIIDEGKDPTITNTYEATYTDGVPTVKGSSTNGTFQIVDTPIPALPSTGGIGTYLFYMLGAALMVAAITMLAKKNKASSSK